MNELYPKPWNEPERRYKPKYNEYFHEKEDIFNSLAHSSPKMSEFYLKPLSAKKACASPVPENTGSSQCSMRRVMSRERMQKRKHERELLQAKSNQCLPGFNSKISENPQFATYKNPSQRPISNKIGSFDNYLDLPEQRLKLVINQRILKMDEKALETMSKKIQKELEDQKIQNQWHQKNREKTLIRMKKKQKKNREIEKKTGLSKVKIQQEIVNDDQSARINCLSVPKQAKVGFPEDYLDSYGLLKAGFLYSGKSIHPKSARRPVIKRKNVFPSYDDQVFNTVPTVPELIEVIKEPKLLTSLEIEESMKELDEFNTKFGEIKGCIGFPQIYLEKYKSK
jgi:hypothetical protein